MTEVLTEPYDKSGNGGYQEKDANEIITHLEIQGE